MKLHEAMVKAIIDLGGGKQHMNDVADYINKHDLYQRKDGDSLLSTQVSARVGRYSHLFSRGDGYIWLNDKFR